jgi:hypothetical protein
VGGADVGEQEEGVAGFWACGQAGPAPSSAHGRQDRCAPGRLAPADGPGGAPMKLVAARMKQQHALAQGHAVPHDRGVLCTGNETKTGAGPNETKAMRARSPPPEPGEGGAC